MHNSNGQQLRFRKYFWLLKTACDSREAFDSWWNSEMSRLNVYDLQHPKHIESYIASSESISALLIHSPESEIMKEKNR